MSNDLCRECQEPIILGWGKYCNTCIAKQERHAEKIKALNNTVDKFCEEAIKNGGFYFKGRNFKITEIKVSNHE